MSRDILGLPGTSWDFQEDTDMFEGEEPGGSWSDPCAASCPFLWSAQLLCGAEPKSGPTAKPQFSLKS